MPWPAIAMAIIAAARQLKAMKEQKEAKTKAKQERIRATLAEPGQFVSQMKSPEQSQAGKLLNLAGSAMDIYSAGSGGSRGAGLGAHTDLTGKPTAYATNYPKGMKKQQQIDWLAELKKYYSY